MAAPSSDADRLLGFWRLVSFQRRFEDTGEVIDVYGPGPRGAIVFGAGRMAVVIAASGRAPPEDEAGMASAFRGMMAYTGRYTVEQDRIVTEVGAAWHPAWEDTRQPRFFALEGDRLTLTTPVQVHPLFPGRPGHGVVVFAREA
jgi:Lipocalin-like domain